MFQKSILPFLVLLLSGCGYTFQGGGSVLPPDVKRIAIPIVQNSSTETGLTTVFTEALREQFDRFGVVTVVEGVEDADAVLKARILKVSQNQRTSTSKTDTELQLDAVLTVAAELRRVSGPVLWRDNNISVSKVFGTTSGVVVTSSADFSGGLGSASDLGSLSSREVSRGQEQEALRALSAEVAREIYDGAVSPDF